LIDQSINILALVLEPVNPSMACKSLQTSAPGPAGSIQGLK
jgi:hypothetical protein